MIIQINLPGQIDSIYDTVYDIPLYIDNDEKIYTCVVETCFLSYPNNIF